MSARRETRRRASPPGGFRYLPEFINPEQEVRLVQALEALPFERPVMRGVEARREVAHFGARYGYDGGTLAAAPPLPGFLSEVCARAAAEARFPADASVEALVTRYPPGAGIGWHRDAPAFGPSLAGLSLAAACDLRLRLATPAGYEVYRLTLAPRSLYVVTGAARFRWQHSIPPVPRLRYSVTFRTIRAGP